MAENTVRLDGRTVELSNLDKPFFPDSGLAKGDLVDYYRKIADTLLPYLTDRPLNMHRYPDGLEGAGFIQQNVSDYFPDWISTVTVDKSDGEVTHVVCNDAATLVYLANQACLTPHIWLSRADRIGHPDLMVFDLDPANDDFGEVRDAARALRDLLGELGLDAWVKSTGSKGVHVAVPLDRSADFETVREFSQRVAAILAKRFPDRFTTEQRKDARRGRLFIDTNRNAYGQTIAAPYAVRARPGAPVSAPLRWKDLDDANSGPRDYTIRNIFRRLGQIEDPWKGIFRNRRSLDEAREELEKVEKEN